MSEVLTDAWLERDSSETAAERAFLDGLEERARSWGSLGLDRDDVMVLGGHDGTLAVGVNVTDREQRCVLRLLRVDFDGAAIACGEDETHQFVTDLHAGCDGFTGWVGFGCSPRELAGPAADWIESELRRPIERLEWRVGFFGRHIRYVLTDTERVILWSDPQNKYRQLTTQPRSITVVRDYRRTGGAG